MKRIDRCPRSPECVSKVIFQDDNGDLFRFDNKQHDFVAHECSTKGASKLPDIAYAAEWHNVVTGRTRYLGPERMRRSVEKPPTDERFRKRGAGENSVWQHKRTYVVELNWTPVKD